MRKFLIITFVSIILLACNKIKVEKPDLNVITDKLLYKVGDSVKFNLSGYADYIYFYSGENGSDYSKAGLYKSPVSGKPEMSFQTNLALGTGTLGTKNLSILVSNDFTGILDTTNIRKATWTDITSRVVLSTTTTTVSSGNVDLSDLKSEGKPIFVAFRYISVDPNTSTQRRWRVLNFNFTTTYPDGTVYTNGNGNLNSGFSPVNFYTSSPTWVNGANLEHAVVNPGSPAVEDWAISKQFDLDRLNPALTAVSEKITSIETGAIPEQFIHIYNSPGSYNAVIVARNATVDNHEEVVKKFNITVEQ
nr:DUF5017 domain-containing protein [uncultured Pedobacter sp.]